MTGAMYAAIAGLKSHMAKMNVIGNNIANVNTAGYKSQRAVFQDAMYTMYKSGSNGSTVKAGNNPSQIGYGSNVAGIDLNMTGQGSFTPGNALDQMIMGDGFFLVGDKNLADTIKPGNAESFKNLSLTRVGQFRISPDGYLTDINGKCVYGFATVGVDAEGKPIVSDQLVPIRVPRMEQTITKKDGTVISQSDFDKLTKDEQAECKIETTIHYPVAATKDGKPAFEGADLTAQPLEDYWPLDADGKKVQADQNPLPLAALDSINIDPKTGRVSGTVKGKSETVTIGYLAMGNVTNPNGVTHTGEYYYKAGDGAGDLSVSMLGGVEKELTTVGGGKLQYVNGSLNQAPVGGGDAPKLPESGRIGSAGATELFGGGYEGSNTDLATEISDMITTQRGYQANTRIITVTDSMLEELVNMKR